MFELASKRMCCNHMARKTFEAVNRLILFPLATYLNRVRVSYRTFFHQICPFISLQTSGLCFFAAFLFNLVPP